MNGAGVAGGQVRVAADERLWRYVPIECAQCGVCVRVVKFSPKHTSVQWTRQAVLGCAEFAARVAVGGNSALVPTCASLRDSVDDAVASGRVEVSSP